jgi:hypothetical protein
MRTQTKAPYPARLFSPVTLSGFIASRSAAVAVALVGLAACGPSRPDEAVQSTRQAVLCQDQELCYRDQDRDGVGAGSQILSCDCNQPGYSFKTGDCDDNNASHWRMLSCYSDTDGDGHGAGNPAQVCAGVDCSSVANKTDNNDDCATSDSARWQNLPCYSDNDGDHYGAGAASTVCVGLTCAAGVAHKAESAGDCDDGNAAIHPHNLEVASNGIDDNCENGPDEAVPYFYTNGNGNTSSSFRIKLNLNSAAEIANAAGNNLYGKVYYRKLENASDPYQVTALAPATVVGSTAEFTVSGLEDLKVYEARVDLYRVKAVLNGPNTPPDAIYERIVPQSGCSGDSSSRPPCSNSGVYYTITLPAGTGTTVKTARANVVLLALSEFHHFRTHPMGSWDDSLMDRYQLASPTSAYCSEFYANAAEPFLVDMNPCRYVSAAATPQCNPNETSTGEYVIGNMKTWFSAYANGYQPFEADPDFSDGKPGDWVGVNPNATWPDGQHSQMFLGYDAAAAQYWFVEGNGSYSNGWGSLAHTVNVGSTSRCDNSAGWYCPASASAVCTSGCFYVKSVGKVANANMVD